MKDKRGATLDCGGDGTLSNISFYISHSVCLGLERTDVVSPLVLPSSPDMVVGDVGLSQRRNLPAGQPPSGGTRLPRKCPRPKVLLNASSGLLSSPHLGTSAVRRRWLARSCPRVSHVRSSTKRKENVRVLGAGSEESVLVREEGLVRPPGSLPLSWFTPGLLLSQRAGFVQPPGRRPALRSGQPASPERRARSSKVHHTTEQLRAREDHSPSGSHTCGFTSSRRCFR